MPTVAGTAEAPVPIPPRVPAPGEELTALDTDRDGTIDLWRFSRRGPDGKLVPLRQERDLNGDGRTDVWEELTPDGKTAQRRVDLDFDGKVDVALFFEGGHLSRKAYAFGKDGQPHAWAWYAGGKLVRRERDTRGEGRVDTWEHWDGDVLDRVGVDTDRDGQPDRWQRRPAQTQK